MTWQFTLATELSEMGKQNVEVVTVLTSLSAIVVNSRFKICNQIWNFIEHNMNVSAEWSNFTYLHLLGFTQNEILLATTC